MSTTIIRWSESDEAALAVLQARLQALSPQRTLTRPDLVRLLVRAVSAGLSVEQLMQWAMDPPVVCTCTTGPEDGPHAESCPQSRVRK